MPKQVDPGNEIAAFFGKIFGEVKKHAPAATKTALSMLLRGMTNNRAILQDIGKHMAELEEIDWTTLSHGDKLLWSHRAENALVALNGYMFREADAGREDTRGR